MAVALSYLTISVAFSSLPVFSFLVHDAKRRPIEKMIVSVVPDVDILEFYTSIFVI